MSDDRTCQDCLKEFKYPADLEKHKKKKYPCTQGDYPCRLCSKHFQHQSGRSRHEKTCQGPPRTVSGQQKEIDNLKKAMQTIDAQQHQLNNGASTSISHCETANVHNGDNNITVIQNNITVNTCGKEDVTFIKSLPSDELYNLVKRNENILTLSELFRLLRLDPAHPQNHNLLLLDKDADEIHYKSKSGWKTGGTESVLDGCLAKDGQLLQCCLNKNQNYESLPEDQKQLWMYIALEVMPHIGAVAYPPFQKYYDSAREYLSESTRALCDEHQVSTEIESTITNEDLGKVLLIERSKEKQKELEAQKMLITKETKGIELQIELAKLEQLRLAH